MITFVVDLIGTTGTDDGTNPAGTTIGEIGKIEVGGKPPGPITGVETENVETCEITLFGTVFGTLEIDTITFVVDLIGWTVTVLGKYDGEIMTGFVGHNVVGGKPPGPVIVGAGGVYVEIAVISYVGTDVGRSFELTTTLFVDGR